jgi:hypothetical protein
MIKNLFLFFAVLGLFATLSKAQVSSVTGQYLQDNNILLNPGFESGIGKWTNSAGTFTADYTNFVQGKASGKIVLSSQALAFTQDSTSYVTALADGVQGLVSVYIKSEFPAKVCSRSAGSTVTTNCVDVVGNNKWSLYKVPSILGATSNGISVNTNGTSVTGTIYIDESFVGITDLAADVDASRIAGESYFAGTVGCVWGRTSTTIGAFGAVAACPGPTIVHQYLGSWQTTDADLPKQTINNLPAGIYKATFIFLPFSGVSNFNQYVITDGTTNCTGNGTSGTGAGDAMTISCVFKYTATGNKSFEIYASSDTGSVNIANNSGTGYSRNTKFILEYFGSSSVYTSTNADTDWASCGHTTSDFTGFGTVTNIETQCKRQGGDLLMRGKFTSGPPTAVEARVNLKLGGTALTSASTSKIPTIQIAGINGLSSSQTAVNFTTIEPSVGYVTFSRNDGSGTLTKVNGSGMVGAGQTYALTAARIPVNGWENSNIIIGQFNGLESCTDSYECTDTFSAKVSAAGVASDENLDWINGNCSFVGGQWNCPFKSSLFTVSPNCNITRVLGGTSGFADIETVSTTNIIINTRNSSGTAAQLPFNIICQKQGVDYIGKTAKAVASDQNVASPGTIKSTLCSAKISSTGVISNQKGGCFASCTNATTPVCTFTSNYWVSGEIPNCWFSSESGGLLSGGTTTSTNYLAEIRSAASPSTAVVGNRIYYCHGERQ